MQVKGTGIKTTREFVAQKFPTKYEKWLKSLSPESFSLYNGGFDICSWYPIHTAYYEPMDKIASILFNNDPLQAGDELGRFSAELSLKGIYNVFLLVATPQYLTKKATNMMQAFYKPSIIEVPKASSKGVLITIKRFDTINRMTEFRIAGWCARAFELCHQKNVKYRFLSHLSAGAPETVIEFTWD
jgi:hypothetical protein